MHFIEQGDSVTVNPFVHHNMYMSANTVIHIVKYDDASGTNWFSSKELDALTKHISESELILLEYESLLGNEIVE